MSTFLLHEKRLEQVLSILLDNGLRYTPKGRESRLSANVHRDRRRFTGERNVLWLTVSDQGCGIDDEVKKHVFERFYRADGSRSNKQHYGLGLSIAKELVQLHGGTISVSDSGSVGASFVVKLLVAE